MEQSAQPGKTSIRDLGLATALVSLGFQINETQRDAGGRAYFLFDDSEKLKSVVESYYANTLMVPARTYSDNSKMLKTRIYSGR